MAESVQATKSAAVDAVPSTNGRYEEIMEHQPDRKVLLVNEKGAKEEYTLRELSESDLAWWMKRMGQRVVTNARTGKPVKQDYDGLHVELIGKCLYDRSGKPASKTWLASLGSKALSRLYAICREVSGLDDKGEEAEEKN